MTDTGRPALSLTTVTVEPVSRVTTDPASTTVTGPSESAAVTAWTTVSHATTSDAVSSIPQNAGCTLSNVAQHAGQTLSNVARPVAGTAVSATSNQTDLFLDGLLSSSVPWVMTSTPAAKSAPRFSIRTLPSDGATMEESLEVLGLDEVMAIRPTVTARQRKSKSSSSVSTNNTNPPQKNIVREGARTPEKNGARQPSVEVSVSPRAKLLRDSPRFSKMALLSVNVDSTKRRDASVYDMVHTRESAESSLSESLMDIAAELGTRPIDIEVLKQNRNNRMSLASGVKMKQAETADIPSPDHTVVAASDDDVEPELLTRLIDNHAAKLSQKMLKNLASRAKTKLIKTTVIPSPVHTTSAGSMSDSFPDVEPKEATERGTAVVEVTGNSKKAAKSKKRAKTTDLSLTPRADNSRSTSKSLAAKKATKRANTRLGTKKRATKVKQTLSTAVEKTWTTKTTSRLRQTQARSTACESLPSVKVKLPEEREVEKLSTKVKKSSVSAAEKKQATKRTSCSHLTQTVDTVNAASESLPDTEMTSCDEKEAEKLDKRSTRKSASTVVKTGNTLVRSSPRNKKSSTSNLEVGKPVQEPAKKNAKSSVPAADQSQSSAVSVLPDSQTSKSRPNRKKGKLTKRSSNEVVQVVDNGQLKSLEQDSACKTVALSDGRSPPALTSKDANSACTTRSRNRLRQLSSHQEKENQVEHLPVPSQDKSSAGQ